MPRKIGARGSAKFQRPGSSREETGMAMRTGGARSLIRTVVRVKDKDLKNPPPFPKLKFKRKK